MIPNGSKNMWTRCAFLRKEESLFCKYSFMHILVFIEPNVTNDFPTLPQLQKACYNRNFVRNFFCFWVLNLSLTLPRALAIKSFDTNAAKILPASSSIIQLEHFCMKFGFNFRVLLLASKCLAALLFGTFWTLYVINSVLL